MASLIGRFLGGLKAYFGKEFRYYTITFLIFLVLVGILAPLFMILDVQAWNNIEIVYIIGSSSASVYLIYSFMTLGGGMRRRFFQTKWRLILGLFIPLVGTAGFAVFFLFLSGMLPNLLYYILIIALLTSFVIWLVIQLFFFSLFIRDINRGLIEKIEGNEAKQNRRFIIFAIIFQILLVVYLFAFRTNFNDITDAINVYLVPFPFSMWIFPIILAVLSGVIFLISLLQRKYENALFSTGYILLFSLFLLYHVAYLMIYIYKTELFVGALNLISLLIFAFILIYTLQSIGGQVKTKLEKWWQPISFFLFTILLLYITWSVTFLHSLATESLIDLELLEIYFWGINHLISYIFGVVVLIVTVFMFI
jgi:hypothetical protein